ISETTSHIEDAGVIPTPAIALLTKNHEYAGGIMISASHNPFDDNGIKVFSSDGRKLKDADEIAVEKRISEILASSITSHAIEGIPDHPISAKNLTKWPERYEELLLSHFPEGR